MMVKPGSVHGFVKFMRLFILLAPGMLIACSESSVQTQSHTIGKLEFASPAKFRQMPRFDPDQLIAKVSINGAEAVTFFSNDQSNSELWAVPVNVNLDESNTIEISWIEIIDDRELLLSEQMDVFYASSQTLSAEISAEHISSGDPRFDVDSDSESNLDERLAGTDPFEADPIEQVIPNCTTSDCVSANAVWSDNTVVTRRQAAFSTYALAIQRIVYCLGHADQDTYPSMDQFADGIYGPNSEIAVMDYQMSKDLLVDGKVGKNTWNALQSELTGPLEFDGQFTLHHVQSELPGCDTPIQFFQEIESPMGWQMAATHGSTDRIPMSAYLEDLPDRTVTASSQHKPVLSNSDLLSTSFQAGYQNLSEDHSNRLVAELAPNKQWLLALLHEYRLTADTQIAASLANLLRRINSAQIVAFGADMAKAEHPQTRLAGFDLLRGQQVYNSGAIEITLNLLAFESDPLILVSALNALAVPDPARSDQRMRAIEYFKTMSTHLDPRVRHHSVALLSRWGEQQNLNQHYLQALSDPDERVRTIALLSLINTEHPNQQVVDALMGVATDPAASYLNRLNAQIALQRLGMTNPQLHTGM
ncbi:MAG: peptidoglycan-binding protein [Granulosicoccus sp.]|nr:peptidoglycan-binding protein [Granulosicoccus sp.]